MAEDIAPRVSGQASVMTAKRLYKLGTPLTVILGASFFLALVWHHPPAWLGDVLLLFPLAFMGMATVAKPGQLVDVRSPGPVMVLGLVIAAVVGMPLGFHAGEVWHVTDIRYPLLAFGAFLLACCAYGVSASPNSVPKVSRLSVFVQRANARRSPAKPTSKAGWALSAAIGVFALWNYSYAAFTVLDEQLDRSPPKLFQPLVIAKHTFGLRFRYYEVKLSPWGPFSDARQIDVEPEAYDALNVGNPACISLHQPASGIPSRTMVRRRSLSLCPRCQLGRGFGLDRIFAAGQEFELAVGGCGLLARQPRAEGVSEEFDRDHLVAEVGRRGLSVVIQKVSQNSLSWPARAETQAGRMVRLG